MDPRLLQYYNLELQHLREMGAEFAQQFPKIAARLGMNGLDVADPYVERLLEGVGFLAARVHLKLDAEFPRFTQALLENIYPHFLSPTPSMLVAQMIPDGNEPNLAGGVTVPRGSTMQGALAGDDVTACEFRTAQDVTLWPIDVTSVSYFSFAPDLPLAEMRVTQRVRGGLRIRLRTTAGLDLSQIALDRLPLYIAGGEAANTLYELCTASVVGAFALPLTPAPRPWEPLSPSVRVIGFDDGDAVLPATLRSFEAYRLLQEYFAFPQRFRFVEIGGLARALKRMGGREVELVLLFGRGEPALESVVTASNVALFCTPAINLFPKRADRIHVDEGTYEYHVVPDRTRPLDFEVYEVTELVGYGIGADSERQFLPFYAAHSTDAERHGTAYFTSRREPRLVTTEQRRRGERSSYIGTELFLSLVDSMHAPFSSDLRQLSVHTLCTNRDLVLQMPVGLGRTDFTLEAAAPVERIRVVSGPSRPHAPLADGAVAWRAVSHLSLNYLSLMSATGGEAGGLNRTAPRDGAAALRELLELYAGADSTAKKQIEGIRSVQVTPIVRRLPPPVVAGPRVAGASLAFGRGVEITVEVEDLAFEGGSAYLLGSVLNQYFSRYVSMNSFTETVMRSQRRGEIHRWQPHWGTRPTL